MAAAGEEELMLMDCVTELLKDGKWHYIRTIARKLEQPEEKVMEILKFFTEFDIVIMDKTSNRVMIDETFKKLLT